MRGQPSSMPGRATASCQSISDPSILVHARQHDRPKPGRSPNAVVIQAVLGAIFALWAWEGATRSAGVHYTWNMTSHQTA